MSSLAACVAPHCHRTLPRKRKEKRTVPSRCARPNAWQAFRKRVSGFGLTRDEISLLYSEWKQAWSEENPGWSRSASRARMNDYLCEEIRGARPGRFFAKKRAPDDFILTEASIEKMDFPFMFKHARASGGRAVGEPMTKLTVKRLLPGKWFGDPIINSYMSLLGGAGNPGSSKSIFMSSYFWSQFTLTDTGSMEKFGTGDTNFLGKDANKRHKLVWRWTRKLDTTAKDMKFFVPVNAGNSHWYMMMIDADKREVVSMDSVGKDRVNERRDLLGWLAAEYKEKKKPFKLEDWTHRKKAVPKQQNGHDCGPFSCMFAAFMSNDKRMSFLQGDLPKMRKRIAWSILHMTL